MRVIFNIHITQAAEAAGWRAMAVQVNDKGEARLDEALKATTLSDGSSMYDYLIEGDHLGNDWLLIVDGRTITGISSLKTKIKDNVQIHLLHNPNLRYNGN